MLTVEINKDKCIGCAKCVILCPMNILELDENNKAYVTDERKCDAAFGCIRACPVNAITKKEI